MTRNRCEHNRNKSLCPICERDAKLDAAHATIARLNAENIAINRALELAQTRANEAEKNMRRVAGQLAEARREIYSIRGEA